MLLDSALGPIPSPTTIEFRRRSRWGQDVPSLLGCTRIDTEARDALGLLSGPVRDWFAGAFPEGPTPAQRLAWPPIAAGEHLLLVSPTGTGKTLAGVPGDPRPAVPAARRGHAAHRACAAFTSRRCGAWATTSSATWPIPLEAIEQLLGVRRQPGPRRRADGRYLGPLPPQAARPAAAYPDHDAREPLALAQPGRAGPITGAGSSTSSSTRSTRWCPRSAGPTWRSRSSGWRRGPSRDPCRIGLSATCRPAEPVARFLVGPIANLPRGRGAPAPRHAAHGDRGRIAARGRRGSPPRPDLSPADPAAAAGDEGQPDDGHLRQHPAVHREDHPRSETRPEARDVRGERGAPRRQPAVAAHHSALDASRRREVEALLKAGRLKAVVTSTSLELGVDIGTADLSVQVGLPGGVARCVQRVGRSGHRAGGGLAGLDARGHRGRARRRGGDGAGRARRASWSRCA